MTGVVHALALPAGGRILAVGKDTKSSPEAFGLYRFASSGAPDTDFGSAGRSIATFGSDDAEARAVVMLAQRKVVVAENVNGFDGDFALARYYGRPDFRSWGAPAVLRRGAPPHAFQRKHVTRWSLTAPTACRNE